MLKSFVKELNDKVNEYVFEKKLFWGGCCYAAYLLAEAFVKAGIQYKVVLFETHMTLTKDFNKSINNGFGVDHIAIQVKPGKKNFIIGDLTDFLDYRGRDIRRYKDVTPEMLLDAYENNIWNDVYNTDYNPQLKKEIFGICAKYGCGAAE